MNLLDRLGRWVRTRFPLWHRFERWVWGLPAFPGAVLTALGHGLLTALGGPFAPVVATLYTIRELTQARDKTPTNQAPLYDSVLDVVVPWLVVCFYVWLVASWVN